MTFSNFHYAFVRHVWALSVITNFWCKVEMRNHRTLQTQTRVALIREKIVKLSRWGTISDHILFYPNIIKNILSTRLVRTIQPDQGIYKATQILEAFSPTKWPLFCAVKIFNRSALGSNNKMYINPNYDYGAIHKNGLKFHVLSIKFYNEFYIIKQILVLCF